MSNKSPETLKTYGEAARQLHSFLVAHGMPTEVAKITREHVETFLEDPAGQVEAGHGEQPLPGAGAALQVGRGRG